MRDFKKYLFWAFLFLLILTLRWQHNCYDFDAVSFFTGGGDGNVPCRDFLPAYLQSAIRTSIS